MGRQSGSLWSAMLVGMLVFQGLEAFKPTAAGLINGSQPSAQHPGNP
jgi:hypothetical protein